MAGKAQWSVFEDHTALVRSGPVKREKTLREIQQELGADTLRVEVKWSEVAPSPNSAKRPTFDATNPATYGAGNYDDLIVRANAMGMRVLITLTGDAPRWATAGGKGRSFATANYRPSPTEFGRFAAAMATRYSGRFAGLPAVRYFTIWNEPNHIQFLKPLSASPGIYRNLVNAAIPQIRRNAVSGAKIFVGETAPVGRAGRATGPVAFLRRWLCLNKNFHRAGCSLKKIDADGFAHHFYGPVDRVPASVDIINILAVRRLAKYLDRAANAGRLPRKLLIYNTEFGLQSNPPDFTVSTTPVRQAALINEKEEYSYRYGRLKSYSQYLLNDDPPRPGGRSVRWSGFQTGLRFPNGKKKPAYSAYRFPIVVHRRGRGVSIWGRVRPGSGRRYVQLYDAGGKRSGGRIATNSSGYFGVKRARTTRYRFKAYSSALDGRKLLGNSRTARPIR